MPNFNASNVPSSNMRFGLKGILRFNSLNIPSSLFRIGRVITIKSFLATNLTQANNNTIPTNPATVSRTVGQLFP